jgi:outer membrane protein
MKIIRIAAIAALLAFSTVAAQAQNKFGHINSADLVSALPDTKSADAQLKKFTEDLQNQLQAMSQELDTKYKDYQKSASTMADAVKEIRAKEITDLQQRIEDFQQSANDNVSKKKEELYGPILKKAEEAVKQVAKEGKYSYIFDTSVGTVIYAQESDDIMALVAKKLGLKEVPKSRKDEATPNPSGTTTPKAPQK